MSYLTLAVLLHWATAAIAPAHAGASAGAQRARPVIISTDPGIDDAIALLLALSSPELELRAIGINFGSLKNTTQLAQNALTVLALAGREDVPVYLGAERPLSQPFHDLGGPKFHGTDGLGGAYRAALPPSLAVNRSMSAAEFIVHACRHDASPKPPLLVSLAPLTNVALALNLEPRLPELCPDLYLMGGTVLAPGNVGFLSEANVANDPEAAARVLSAGFHTRVAGLDVTMATWLSHSFLASLQDLNVAGSFIWNITRFYERAHHELAGFEGGMPLHDPSTLLMFLQERSYELKRWPVWVDTSPFPSVSHGLMLPDRRGGPLSPPPPRDATVHFGMSVNATSVRQLLRARIAATSAEFE
ncbi:Probable uridine nucleosidase 1 (Uridine ribohydrolase 1) [Durusdinium trenchii]|uniref:Probable uridine nucleosidase 1 (Uridine ribohydrolase 1) n=1 Tax=Durusdinium trenchii TaxID=1381693 RepID=A0ABP0N0N1_9DINO